MSESEERRMRERERDGRAGRIARWMMRPARRVWVAVLFLGMCALIGGLYYTINKLTTDEHHTCEIQSRGLDASHALTQVIQDIHVIINPVPAGAANSMLRKELAELRAKQLAALPPVVRAYDLALEAQTAADTSRYVQLESKTPGSRKC